MNIFLSGLIILGFSQIAFAAEFGKQVDIYSDNSGPQFSTIFANDTDKVWNVTFSIWGGDLLPNFSMKTLAWRLWDTNAKKYINKWIIAEDHPAPVMYPGTMSYSWELQLEDEVFAAIHSLPNLKLVLSVDQDLSEPVATHYIDLGSYCKSNPKNFVNLTTGGSGCKAD